MTARVSLETPTPTSARSLAPDLARGLMLLAIAVAHAPALAGGLDVGPTAPNRAAEFVTTLFVDNQARSMFVFLFGYGLGQLVLRRTSGGTAPKLTGTLRRRGFWLLVIGFAHATLLVPIDILATYGLALLLLAPLVLAEDKDLVRWSLLILVPATMLLAWQGVTSYTDPVPSAELMAGSYGAHIIAELPSWPVETAISVLMVVPGILLGIWAARRRILDEPERHAASLRRAAAVLIGLSIVGRLPAALLTAGLWTADSGAVSWTVFTAHTLAGFGGGIGLAAAVGLAAIRIGAKRGPATTALVALGQRSLTFYLAQSVVWLALFYPFTLDLTGTIGPAAALGIAVAVWVATVIAAEWMRRAGQRGPAEVLLRRLSYRRR